MGLILRPNQRASKEVKEEWLRKQAEILNIELPKKYVTPLDKIFELQDDPNTAYVWKFKEQVTNTELNHIFSEVSSRFVRQNNREPMSIHIMTTNIEEIKKISPEKLKEHVIPWIEMERK
jgi:hypothetical protein